MAVHRHRGPNVARAAGVLAAHLHVRACTGLVDDQLAFARRSTGHVGYADVRPEIHFTYHLIKLQIRSDYSPDYLVWRHAGNPNVSSAAEAMLTSVFTAHSIIDLLGTKR